MVRIIREVRINNGLNYPGYTVWERKKENNKYRNNIKKRPLLPCYLYRFCRYCHTPWLDQTAVCTTVQFSSVSLRHISAVPLQMALKSYKVKDTEYIYVYVVDTELDPRNISEKISKCEPWSPWIFNTLLIMCKISFTLTICNCDGDIANKWVRLITMVRYLHHMDVYIEANIRRNNRSALNEALLTSLINWRIP